MSAHQAIINAKKLFEASAFADCQCPVSEPNMMKAREHIGVLADALAKKTEDCLRYLSLLEYAAERRGDEGRWEDIQKARAAHEADLRAVTGGRVTAEGWQR